MLYLFSLFSSIGSSIIDNINQMYLIDINSLWFTVLYSQSCNREYYSTSSLSNVDPSVLNPY